MHIFRNQDNSYRKFSIVKNLNNRYPFERESWNIGCLWQLSLTVTSCFNLLPNSHTNENLALDLCYEYASSDNGPCIRMPMALWRHCGGTVVARRRHSGDTLMALQQHSGGLLATSSKLCKFILVFYTHVNLVLIYVYFSCGSTIKPIHFFAIEILPNFLLCSSHTYLRYFWSTGDIQLVWRRCDHIPTVKMKYDEWWGVTLQ
jgi:hypothetical protein